RNGGDAFTGRWVDTVWLSDSPDLDQASQRWQIGSIEQQRSLGNGESYQVAQTIRLAPSVSGRYVIVKTDAGQQLVETIETNNTARVETQVTATAADLRVAAVTVAPQADSGEPVEVRWTVTNHGAAVWGGTEGWIDNIYLS
ncbi:hypothetical protein, partial [Parachitinimonas caeni]